MSYKLIALDIDGTLTNSQKIITQPTKEALLDIQKQGFKVVLASGRPTPGRSGRRFMPGSIRKLCSFL